MKVFLFALLVVSLTAACNTSESSPFAEHLPEEAMEDMNPSNFNFKIKDRMDIQTGEQLMQLYYPFRVQENSEGKESIKIQSEDIGNGFQKVTLIHDHMMDDSQMGLKVILIAELTQQGWVTHLIKQNRKCWPDRGHTDWGVDPCN